ncbi:MAG: lycopene cyclase family protein [Ilumatobacteraceae bacterium]
MSAAAGPDLDVVVVGDGPAGLALAAACRIPGLAVVVVGGGGPWANTYGMWRDEVDVPDRCFRLVPDRTVVEGHCHHDLARSYAIVDNAALRAHLAAGLDVRVGRVAGVQHFTWGSRVLADTGPIDARLVVDATGRPSALTPGGPTTVAQTAFGVVVPEPPPGFDRAAVTLMDLRPLPGPGPATFCYVVPVDGGWLVEETVLAGRPPVPADRLRARLEARIGSDGAAVVDGAARLERVVVPMGGSLPDRRQPVVAFGAAAGLTHPATGFSVAASLRAAPRVAAAIADGPGDVRRVHDAVWPTSLRLTRRLHAYGLEVLLRLDGAELATFFDAFFELPQDVWAPYLRVDASPGEVSRAMTAVLRRLPWAMRRRLVVNPAASLGGR